VIFVTVGSQMPFDRADFIVVAVPTPVDDAHQPPGFLPLVGAKSKRSAST
jgi:hypothetical protein